MGNSGDEGSARLIIVGKTGVPEQYRLSKELDVLPGESTAFKGEHLRLGIATQDLKLGKFRKRLTDWTFTDEAVTAPIVHDDKPMKTGEVRVLRDADALRFGDSPLLAVFMESWSDNKVWKTIPLESNGDAVTIYCQDMESVAAQENPDPNDFYYAELIYQDGKWYVHDHNTRWGVFVNQIRISDMCELKMLDLLTIGNTHFVFRGNHILYDHAKLRENKLQIHIDERTVGSFLKKHVLLEDIDLTIEPGNMVMLLGGSGAGKTTFVNAVTGYEKAKASIREGDLDVYRDYDKIKYQIGFAPQQDMLRSDDSVRMTLVNAAQVRLPKDLPDDRRMKRVETVLELMGLEPVENSLVGKLSGGQRKRLSIAVEYISDPTLFILDEPDSGLDGVMARDLMVRLRAIANQKRIVIVITHTPDRVADLFDKVVVLAKNSEHVGRLAYYGSIADAKAFFGRNTMEEIVRAVNGKNEGGDGLADSFIQKYDEQCKEKAAKA